MAHVNRFFLLCAFLPAVLLVSGCAPQSDALLSEKLEHVRAGDEPAQAATLLVLAFKGRALPLDDYVRRSVCSRAWFGMPPMPCADDYVWSGIRLAERGEYALACGEYAKAAKLAPCSPKAWLHWGAALVAMGQMDKACERFDEAVRVGSLSAEAWSQYGSALARMGRHAEARVTFEKAVEIDPQLAEAWSGWGTALVKLGHHGEGRTKLAEAAKLGPQYANDYENFLAAQAEIHRYLAALEELNRPAEPKPRILSGK